jgi:hypothetical protein
VNKVLDFSCKDLGDSFFWTFKSFYFLCCVLYLVCKDVYVLILFFVFQDVWYLDSYDCVRLCVFV